MTFSVWGNDDGTEFTVLPGIQRSPLDGPDMKLLKTIEAPSFDDALREFHLWKGWGVYKSME